MPTTPQVNVLKIRHNNVLGYFVEVTAQHGDKLMAPPWNATFIHRQTLAGQVRFTTAELGELEAKIANAADSALGAGARDLRSPGRRVVAAADASRRAAEALAAIDVAAALASSRSSAPMCGPEVDDSLDFRRSRAAAIPWSSGAGARRRPVRRQ